jgi:hypothetical protein
MPDSDEGSNPATDTLNNDICANLKTQLDVAVKRSDYSQKVVLSALIANGLDREEADIAALRETELNELLEEYDALYATNQ